MTVTMPITFEVVEPPKLDPENRQLIGHVRINGVDHHVTLMQVVDLAAAEEGSEGFGTPLDEQEDLRMLANHELEDLECFDTTFGDQAPAHEHSRRFQALQDFEDTGEPFRTVAVDGREYVCVITPFTA